MRCLCLYVSCVFFFFKQKTAYEMRISDWSSDVCSSDLPPQFRHARLAAGERDVQPQEEKFTGFVFKNQANMDPKHRDRVAFLRVCSGVYRKGMAIHSVRLTGVVRVSNALVFMAADREPVEEAYPGDRKRVVAGKTG